MRVFIYYLSGDGVFQVKDVRNLLDEFFLPKSNVPTRWVKFIPNKVNIFAWKLFLNRLPTRSNLAKRKVSIDTDVCPVCDSAQEEVAHVFFCCSLARDLTRLICRWWNLDEHLFSSYAEWLSWFNSLRLGSKLKAILEGVFYITWWSVWNFRNHLLFASTKPRKESIFDDIVLRSFSCLLPFSTHSVPFSQAIFVAAKGSAKDGVRIASMDVKLGTSISRFLG
ncbi:RNA-directed DNA polymerase, eukaryota [Tanacetum coccineum]